MEKEIVMLKNYWKTAFRNLWKNKTYGFLNIFGLAVGITCAGFIFLWVEDEKDFNKFHDKYAQLYYVKEHQAYDGKHYTFDATPGILAPAMKQELPGVKMTARASWRVRTLFGLGEKTVYEHGVYADSSLFDIFTLPLVQGNRSTIFSQLKSLVISEKMAKKFFGDSQDVVGKTLRVDNREEYLITGVMKDLPQNSTLRFDWVSPFQVYFNENSWLQSWSNNGILTYVEMNKNTNIEQFNQKFLGYIKSKDTTAVARPFLFPMEDWRLRNRFEDGKQAGGSIQYVRMFGVIAWIILLIACINFMNLATARSEKRAREVGVRKVLGAGRKVLAGQFIGEAIFMAFLAVLLSVAMMYLLLPAFNVIVEKQLRVGLENPSHLLVLVAIGLICGLVAGSYPAAYLSSFNPIHVFKGLRIKGNGAAMIRKGLVIVQFSISIILIIATIIIYQQVQHVKNRELGYSKDNLLQLALHGDMEKNFSVIRQELISNGIAEEAAMGQLDMIYRGSQTMGFDWEGKDPSKNVLITIDNISPQYIKTAGIRIKYGRDFNAVEGTDSLSVIINEAMAKVMGKENPVGSTLKRDSIQYTIAGVTNDFVFGDAYGKNDPLVFTAYPNGYSNMYVKLSAKGTMEKKLSEIERIIKRNNPAYPVEYEFVDQQFNNQFRSENLIGKLSRIFAVLAIIISCLGLFGLAAYTAEKRIKEIGIRKVLGASVSGIAGLLSRDFLILVGISALVAFPLAWWFMHNWLQDFAYRININWWIFGAAGACAALIALITVSFQAIRAALTNPVKSLRSE